MKAVTKYKLQEAFFIIGFFSVIFTLNILLSDVEDLPITRGIIGAVFLGSITSFYEIIISVKLQKKMNTIFFIICNIVFYYLVFSFMLIAYGYIDLIFKQGYSPANAFQVSAADIYPATDFHFMIFYLFIFLFLLQLIRQIRITAIKGVTWNYFKGRIRQSISDTRIFLFMDLYSSTTYAEKLGHKRYSSFIKDIYYELDEFILTTHGSLYQFVGDQVVVVWRMEDGIRDNNVIRFFFLVEEALHSKKEYFMNKYGVVPKFKAGIHCGDVAITEIGNVLKREIAYHGDTVNTTARICTKCKELNRKILVSGDLAGYLNANTKVAYEFLGSYKLKGKKHETELYSAAIPG